MYSNLNLFYTKKNDENFDSITRKSNQLQNRKHVVSNEYMYVKPQSKRISQITSFHFIIRKMHIN